MASSAAADQPIEGSSLRLQAGSDDNNQAVYTPIVCGGTLPTCGEGACPAGMECVPLQGDSAISTACVCATPGDACDLACGGFSCPANEICTFRGFPPACGCEAP